MHIRQGMHGYGPAPVWGGEGKMAINKNDVSYGYQAHQAVNDGRLPFQHNSNNVNCNSGVEDSNRGLNYFSGKYTVINTTNNFCGGVGASGPKLRRPTQIPLNALYNDVMMEQTSAWSNHHHQPQQQQEPYLQYGDASASAHGAQAHHHHSVYYNQTQTYATGMENEQMRIQPVPVPGVGIGGGGQVKFFEAAFAGLEEFRKDYQDENQWIHMQQNQNLMMRQEEPKFGFDEKQTFFDNRPMIDLVRNGDREFRLFDDMKSESDNIRSVYNVNEMDIFNPREICSRRLLQKSVVYWPVDLIGNDMSVVKKSMLKLGGWNPVHTLHNILDLGGYDSALMLTNGTRELDKVCDYGLVKLARMVNGCGVDWNPMGFITFMGFNLHKLFKDLDKKGAVVWNFAGPFVDRNFCLDFTHFEVNNPFWEYEMPGEGGVGMEYERLDWRNKLRLKRAMFGLFSFETLVFIFYTMTGDALQILAAKELHARGWRFHKIFQVWVHVSDDENQKYTYFNYLEWRFCHGSFKVNEGVFEGEPQEYYDALWN